jgi:plastocyanin
MALAVSAASSTGTIQGHVRLSGPAPGNPIIRMGMDPMCAKLNAGPARPVQQIVLRGADGALANAFVTLKGTFANVPPPSAPVVIRQVKCVDEPRVVGAMVGQTLRIVNSDTLAHETHAANSTTNTFKVTQPHSDMVFDYTLKGPEEMLRLACDVHRWMTAWVGVEPHPYFNVTNEAGSFTIANVPPGRHQIRAWHERYGWLTKTVDVKAGATATIDFAYTGQERAGSF